MKYQTTDERGPRGGVQEVPAGHRGNVSLSELAGLKPAGGETKSLDNRGVCQKSLASAIGDPKPGDADCY